MLTEYVIEGGDELAVCRRRLLRRHRKEAGLLGIVITDGHGAAESHGDPEKIRHLDQIAATDSRLPAFSVTALATGLGVPVEQARERARVLGMRAPFSMAQVIKMLEAIKEVV